MNPSPKAIEAAEKEIQAYLTTPKDAYPVGRFVQAAIDEAVKPYKDALEEHYECDCGVELP